MNIEEYSQMGGLHKTIAYLRAQLQEVTSERNGLKTNLSENQVRVAELTAQLQRKSEESDVLKQQLQETKRHLTALMEAVDPRSIINNVVSAASKMREQLQEANGNYLKLLDGHNEDVKEYEKRLQAMTTDRDHWKSLIDGAAAHLVKVEEENSAFEEKLQQAQGETVKVRSEFQGLCVTYQQEIRELNVKIMQVTKERDEANSKAARLKRMFEPIADSTLQMYELHWMEVCAKHFDDKPTNSVFDAFGQVLCMVHDQRGQLQRVQAECGTMRKALEMARHRIAGECYPDHPEVLQIDAALSGSAGREWTERLTKLERVAELARRVVAGDFYVPLEKALAELDG